MTDLIRRLVLLLLLLLLSATRADVCFSLPVDMSAPLLPVVFAVSRASLLLLEALLAPLPCAWDWLRPAPLMLFSRERWSASSAARLVSSSLSHVRASGVMQQRESQQFARQSCTRGAAKQVHNIGRGTHGVVWFGVVWCGVVWCGVVWVVHVVIVVTWSNRGSPIGV